MKIGLPHGSQFVTNKSLASAIISAYRRAFAAQNLWTHQALKCP
jgi:hypothetical protein